jgi:excisionase family DNA binding protein
MEAKLQIDDQFTEAIARRVIREIGPLLKDLSKEDVLFDVESLSSYLMVSKQWVYERVSLKEIPFSKMGHFPRFKKSEIDRWLDTLKVPAINPLSRKLKAIK